MCSAPTAAAAIVSLLIGEGLEAAAIGVIVVLDAVLGLTPFVVIELGKGAVRLRARS